METIMNYGLSDEKLFKMVSDSKAQKKQLKKYSKKLNANFTWLTEQYGLDEIKDLIVLLNEARLRNKELRTRIRAFMLGNNPDDEASTLYDMELESLLCLYVDCTKEFFWVKRALQAIQYRKKKKFRVPRRFVSKSLAVA